MNQCISFCDLHEYFIVFSCLTLAHYISDQKKLKKDVFQVLAATDADAEEEKVSGENPTRSGNVRITFQNSFNPLSLCSTSVSFVPPTSSNCFQVTTHAKQGYFDCWSKLPV